MPWVNDDVAIGELELTRAAGDRRLYVLADVGIVRLKGWASRAASAEANGRSWETARRGLWWRPVKVTVDNPGVPGRLLFARSSYASSQRTAAPTLERRRRAPDAACRRGG